jgi:hypothetical protein
MDLYNNAKLDYNAARVFVLVFLVCKIPLICVFTSKQTTLFWVLTLYRTISVFRRLGRKFCLQFQGNSILFMCNFTPKYRNRFIAGDGVGTKKINICISSSKRLTFVSVPVRN